MKRQWTFTLTRRVLAEPTRTTQHTYTVDSPQALQLLVQRASKDRDVVAYMFERVVDEEYRWRPCDCHGDLAKQHVPTAIAVREKAHTRLTTRTF